MGATSAEALVGSDASKAESSEARSEGRVGTWGAAGGGVGLYGADVGILGLCGYI